MPRTHCFLAVWLAAVTLSQTTAAQQSTVEPAAQFAATDTALPDAPSPGDAFLTGEDPPNGTVQKAQQGSQGKQTKRILGIIPNFRSVSADEKLPPISTHDKFKLMLEDSFDYSNFIYVGLLSGISQTEGSYPEFHSGGPAYARYYWHSFADTLDGNLMTEFVYPVVTREDPRYYTLGRGGFVKRTVYSFSRLVITRSNSGAKTLNFSEIVGNGSAAGIASFYYPSPERTWTKTGQRWVTQVGLDGFANLIKEFWPDVNSRLFHNHY